MSRRTLIILIVIGFAIVVAGVIFFARSRQSPPQTQVQPQELATASLLAEPNGWQLIHHPIFSITFKLPPAWKVEVFDEGKGEVSGVFSSEGLDAVVNVSRQDNLTEATSVKLLSENKNFFKVSRGAIEGIGYVAPITREAPEMNQAEIGGISSSYVLTNRYFVDRKILEISCSLLGPNYKTMIPTCEEIIKSLEFTK